MKPSETPAQYTARMREKYKDALEQIEAEGLNQNQKLLDNFLSYWLGLSPLIDTTDQKLMKSFKKTKDKEIH